MRTDRCSGRWGRGQTLPWMQTQVGRGLPNPPGCRFPSRQTPWMQTPQRQTPPPCGQNDWQTLLKTLLSLAVGNESLTPNKVVGNFIILQQHKNSVPKNFTSQKKKQWGSMHHGQRLHGTPWTYRQTWMQTLSSHHFSVTTCWTSRAGSRVWVNCGGSSRSVSCSVGSSSSSVSARE